ncbi:MAG: efflux RND transporter periplasmic adaptor subunit [Enhydrobacter sp.]|nr:efflux RND transporter periplasmic adaptor subunit [Enhydrobacter sp.]
MTDTSEIDPTRAVEPTGSHGARHGLLLAATALALLTVAIGLGAWRQQERIADLHAAAEHRRSFVPAVRVATVRAASEERPVRLPANTTAFAVANVFARASGYVDARKVDIGDKVKAGDLLATIVAPELDHQIAQAEATLGQLKAAVQQAQANRDLAQVTWHRDHPLVKEGWLPLQQGSIDVQTLKANEAAVELAQANVVAQQSQLDVLRQQKAYQRVVAPFDGVVTQRNIDIGSLVQADAVNSTFMFTVQQSNVIRTQIYVPQDAARGVKPGIKASVTVPELPDRIFSGTVTRIADALQPGSRTLLTEIDIANPAGVLQPGTYCMVELQVPRSTPALLVPAGAIIFNQNGLQVAVAEGGVARLRTITVARDLGTELEVRDGVKAGEQVILNPTVDLRDGESVAIASAPARP